MDAGSLSLVATVFAYQINGWRLVVFMKPCLHWRRRVIIVRTIPFYPTGKTMKPTIHFRPTTVIASILGLVAALTLSCSTPCAAADDAPNTLTEKEKADGWQLLWDGKTAAGWHTPKSDEFPSKSWSMHDGELTVVTTGNGESAAGGDIISQKRYGNFELTAAFKTTKGCNSGIKIFVQPNLSPIDNVTGKPAATGSAIGMEFQILDDANHPDAKLGHDGNRKIGSFYDVMPAANDKIVMPDGEWNHLRIVSKGKHVEFWLNGKMTVEFERGSPAFRAAVAKSKFKDIPQFGEWSDGHILLQEHGSVVSFRNLKIRELPAS